MTSPGSGPGPVRVLPGVPRRRDAERSRALLLTAAAELFAERGYAGTGLRAVARRAGVDAALIARYFGGKDGLYQAVLAADAVVGEPAATATAPAGAPAPGPAGSGEPEAAPGGGDPLEALVARMAARWGTTPASTIGQNVFRCDLDEAARAATTARFEREVLPLLVATAGERPEARLRAELAVVVLVGIGVARTAGTLPELATADPARLAALARELLDAALR